MLENNVAFLGGHNHGIPEIEERLKALEERPVS